MTDDSRLSDLDVRAKIKNFDDLLDSIETLDTKKKSLWKDVYTNALIDRSNAYAMYMQLSEIVAGKSTEWAVHGKTVSTMIEKMSRANDQLIKLAELVERATQEKKSFSKDDIFDKINSQE